MSEISPEVAAAVAVNSAQDEIVAQGTITTDGGQSTEGEQAATSAQETEQKPEEVKKTEEVAKQDADQLAAKFAALSRREKALREKEKAAAMRFEQEKAKLVEQYEQRIKGMIAADELKADPLAAIDKAGLTFEQFAQIILNDGKPTHEMLLNQTEQKMLKKIEELENKLKERDSNEQAQKEAQAKESLVSDIKSLVESDNKYEFIKAEEGYDLVIQTMEEYYNQTLEENGEGKLLSIQEAADAVESYLEQEAEKYLKLQKVQSKFQPKVEAKKEQRQTQTLSNAVSSPAPKTSTRFMSDDESKSEAAKLLKWTD